MRARHRHFKYRSAGASLAFDARYIQGVSNNTTVQTWSDLSGNARNATQATAANRATYFTAIQGGNAILRFDGGDFYTATYTTGTAYSFYIVAKRSGSSTNEFNNATFIIAAGIADDASASGRRFQHIYSDANIFTTSSNAALALTIARNDNWNIHSVTAAIGSGDRLFLLNGGSQQSVSVSGQAGITSGTVRMVIAANSWSTPLSPFPFVGDMGMLVTYESAHSASLRRRLEQHSAFSFKISCN